MVRYKDLEWQGYQYPGWSIAVGWTLTLSSLCCIPAYAVYSIACAKGTLLQVGAQHTTSAYRLQSW